MAGNDAWFVWAAQMINFLILVALLRKFFYRPVLEAIDNRQQEISVRIEQAEHTRQEAEQLAATYSEREQELATARDTMFAKARQEVEAWKQDALAEARAAVDASQSRWWDAMHRDRNRFLQELRERAGRQVHQVARHVLRELADANLEQQLVAVFLDRLTSLDQPARDRMQNGQSEASPITITSALPLSENLQADIRNRVHAEFNQEAPIQFEVDADLICGLELQMGDQRISWNVAETMDSLEHNFAAALQRDHTPGLAGEGSP